MKKIEKRYEAPQAEVIEIKSESVLCASAPAASTNAGGGTETMFMQTIDWPNP